MDLHASCTPLPILTLIKLFFLLVKKEEWSKNYSVMVVPLLCISKLAKSLKDVWHRSIYSVELCGCPFLDTIKGLDYLHVLSIYYADVGIVDAFKLGIRKIN